jgi:manganese/zinc/iron transport system substrate-binding protein
MKILEKSLIMGLLVITTVFTGCNKKEEVAIKDRQIKVVTTIGMIADVVQNIGGNRVAVKPLMGPGVDPHLYKATEGDVTSLNNADIIFYSGIHLEAKLAEILEKLSERKTSVAVAEVIPKGQLLTPPEFEGLHDPHVWFDVTLWIQTINVIVETLSKTDPEKANYFKKNGALYRNELLVLHQEVKDMAADIPKELRVLVTAHDAFNYFARAYDFEVKALQGISTESEAGVKDVQRLASFIADRKIPALFVESSIPKRNIKAVQAAVRARGWNTVIGGELFSDAMGDAGTVEGTYIGMVRHNIHTIHSALSRKELNK